VSPRQRPRDILIRQVNWWWYPATLVPLLALLAASFAGYLPPLVAPLAVFLCIFWLSSLGFALYARIRKKKEPRQ
jgi:hypothetical protein